LIQQLLMIDWRGGHSSYQRFYDVVDREWSRVFPSLAGESLAFALPRATIPTAPLGDFTNCRTPKYTPK
jgi:hypothetical protein